jgi:uncharacterized protein with ACT and thioredoxin-like domain
MSKILEAEGRIDVLKLDCEGCESEIANCMDKGMMKRVEMICMEVHDEEHVQDLISRFKVFGYVPEIRRTENFSDEWYCLRTQ